MPRYIPYTDQYDDRRELVEPYVHYCDDGKEWKPNATNIKHAKVCPHCAARVSLRSVVAHIYSELTQEKE